MTHKEFILYTDLFLLNYHKYVFQISRIDGCQLNRVDSLDFDYGEGACNTSYYRGHGYSGRLMFGTFIFGTFFGYSGCRISGFIPKLKWDIIFGTNIRDQIYVR